MKIFTKILRRFCHHEWALVQYQMMSDNRLIIYKCIKCGQHKYKEKEGSRKERRL